MFDQRATHAAVAFCLFLIWSSQGPAVQAEEDLNGREIAQRAQDRDTGDDECSTLEMRLVTARGEVRSREFLSYRRNSTQGKKTLMKFWRPADIKDTGNLDEEVKGADDIQYLYLPATQKLRRVSSKNQSWVGSDFIYEDLQELELDDYVYESLPSEMIDGDECYVYSMKPISPEKSEYGKRVMWVRKSDYVVMQVGYYERGGAFLKVMRASDLRATDGVIHAWLTVMRNVQDDHRTELRRRWVVVNSGMPDSLLTTRQLQKPIDLYDYPPHLWERWKTALVQADARP